MSSARRRKKSPASKPAIRVDAAVVAKDSFHIDALTGLRGLAAFLVFGFHAWVYAGLPDPAPGIPWLSTPLRWWFQIGWSGVDIFFTLSAFLLAWPYAQAAMGGRPAPNLGNYLRRRVLRIFPAYYLQLALILACSYAGIRLGGAVPSWRGGGDAVAHAFLWLHLWPAVFPMLAPWWTLPVEFGFYLLLPFLSRALRPGRWPWLLLPIAASWAWRAYWASQPSLGVIQHDWAEHLPGRIDQFAIGMLAAYAAVASKRSGVLPTAGKANLIFFAGVLAFLLLPALTLNEKGLASELLSLRPAVLAWHTLASLAVAAILLACAASAPWAGRALAARPWLVLGKISYSVYLWHLPVILWVHSLAGTETVGSGAAFWGFASLCLLCTLAIASLSWWAVERPAQRWGERRQVKMTV